MTKDKNLTGKFKRMKDGSWKSGNGRWRIIRSATGRYDLHDLTRKKDDTLVLTGVPTVAACEDGARGHEWADRVEKEPSGKAPE